MLADIYMQYVRVESVVIKLSRPPSLGGDKSMAE